MATVNMFRRIALQYGRIHTGTLRIYTNNSIMSRAMMSRSSSNNSLPYHIVVGMPALSPTMEQGTLSAWKLEEGEAFSAGDSLAEIETDKASIDFEAQDDGFIAKYLVSPGDEVKVGEPIMVTVEEDDQIEMFKDFTVMSGEANSPVVEENVKEETPAPVTPSVAKVEAPPVSAPAPVAASSPSPVLTPVPEGLQVAAETGVESNIAWDPYKKIKSPITRSLAASQEAYHQLYGSTGHKIIGDETA